MDQFKLLFVGLPLGVGFFLLVRWMSSQMSTITALCIVLAVAYVLLLSYRAVNRRTQPVSDNDETDQLGCEGVSKKG